MTQHVLSSFFLVLPSWMPPNTWSLGRTRLWTVFKSSTQPTLWSSFGTQSRKPKGKMQSILLIFFLQVRFHLDFQEAITHRRFITLSVILASPLKLTMAFKVLFTRHFVFFRFLKKKNFFFLVSIFFFLLINIFFFYKGFDLFSHWFQIFFMDPMTFIPGSPIISLSVSIQLLSFFIIYFL